LKLRELQDSIENLKFYYVGGFVRDTLRQTTPKDVDIIACGLDEPELCDILTKAGQVQLVGAAFGIFMFRAYEETKADSGVQAHNFPNEEEDFVQISMPRAEVSTGPGHRDFEIVVSPDISLKEDSSRRDFTVNSMYLPLDFEDAEREVIDFQKGMKDLRKEVIQFVGNGFDRIHEDPLRILRAFRMASKGFRIHKQSKDAISALAYLLEEVSPERMRTELEEILLSKKPSKIIKLMLKLGVLETVMQELADCASVTQSKKYHKFDVFTHCVHACDNAPEDLVLRLAALLHDIGKPSVRSKAKDGHYTFYNHEIFSEKKARTLLERLRFPNKLVQEVCFLISNHMFHYSREWSDKAVRRWIKSVGIENRDLENLEDFPLFQLRKADRLGSGFKTIPVTQRQKDFENRIVRVIKESTAFSIADLDINGFDLMDRFDLKPTRSIEEGKLIGRILRKLLDMVFENPKMNEKELLLKEAEKILTEEQ
jgi:poly(A) polymerase/tRNA nucleotidyltransferase (CCA-adding enzyme)